MSAMSHAWKRGKVRASPGEVGDKFAAHALAKPSLYVNTNSLGVPVK